MSETVNIFAKPANTFASSAVAFIDGAKASATLATPFARSTLAALVGQVSTVSMLESMVLSLAGSPRSPKTGKLIAKVSGLRDAIEAGDAIRKAWDAVIMLHSNIDADMWVVAPIAATDDSDAVDGIPGASAIRPLIEGFILETSDAPKALGTRVSGLVGAVSEAMKAHSDAVALHMGVVKEEPKEEGDAQGDAAPVTSLSDRAATMLVALRAASDDDFSAAQEALAMLSDYIDSRWNHIADGTAHDAPGETEADVQVAFG